MAKDTKKALALMQEARKLLFQQLHAPGSPSKELIKGVDKLGLAFEFAENPENPLSMCPACGSFAVTETGGIARCAGCSSSWTKPEEQKAV
ncbi:MAG: hypothetical protein C0617_09810 [Desulfuromonas sp.]|uniref:hypothetical protein n=1 Tax=Desulfuromonas sp. TaxID=892 RepID=UPI000CC1ADC6|nr:hypothetical protein [Desulfuromonas sp.]PLX83929.1 MAG: hypothetical protein C0617_09810 [Desulfuromonas sp.]